MSSLDQDVVVHDHFSFRKISLPKTDSNSSCRLTFDEWNKRNCKDFVNYKKAVLELAKDAPESVYELSLRDLVELSTITRIERENTDDNEEKLQKNKSISFHKQLMRSMSLKSRKVLNVFFPICKDTMVVRNAGLSDNLLEHAGRSYSSGSSSSSSSSKSSSGSSSCRSSKSCSDIRQKGGVQTHCGRPEVGCYPFFIGQNYKSESKRN